MKKPRFLASYLLNVGRIDESQAEYLVGRLLSIRGVAEAVVVAGDGIAYLKVDSKNLDEDALSALSVESGSA